MKKPFYLHPDVIYDELLRLCDEDREYLEQELCLIEVWENMNRDQALHFMWQLRTYFEESYTRHKETKKIAK